MQSYARTPFRCVHRSANCLRHVPVLAIVCVLLTSPCPISCRSQASADDDDVELDNLALLRLERESSQWFLERAKHIPVRLKRDERKLVCARGLVYVLEDACSRDASATSRQCCARREQLHGQGQHCVVFLHLHVGVTSCRWTAPLSSLRPSAGTRRSTASVRSSPALHLQRVCPLLRCPRDVVLSWTWSRRRPPHVHVQSTRSAAGCLQTSRSAMPSCSTQQCLSTRGATRS